MQGGMNVMSVDNELGSPGWNSNYFAIYDSHEYDQSKLQNSSMKTAISKHLACQGQHLDFTSDFGKYPEVQ